MALIRQAESPDIKIDGDDREYTYAYKILNTEDFEQYIPAKNTENPDGDGYFRYARIARGVAYSTLYLTYGKYQKSGTNLDRTNGSTERTIRGDILEKPLEYLGSDYRTKWNYNLYSTNSAASTPAWWTSATDQSDTNGSTTWAWAKSKPGDGWYKIKDMTKPGVESYILIAPVITERKFYRKKTDAQAVLQMAGTIQEPDDTYSYNLEWLIINPNLYFDGTWWVAECEYIGADEWDTDLYD